MNPPQPNSEERSHRVAAIDVGTNSIRLIVAEASSAGEYRVIDDEKEVTRLGRGLASTGRLSEESMAASAQTIARMREIADGYGVEVLRAVGTCAVREAENGPAFITSIEESAGITLEMITAEEEARLAFMSVGHAFDLRPFTAAVVDIGGGSTELVISVGGIVEQVFTLPLGTVRLTELVGGEETAPERRLREMRTIIRKALRKHVGDIDVAPQIMIGTGGTFTSLANISFHRNNVGLSADTHPFTVRGYEMSRSELRHLQRWLNSMSLRARTRVPGLSPDRAEIIVAGAVIIDRLMKSLGVRSLRVHDRGIRDGLLLTMIRDLLPASEPAVPRPLDRLSAVRRFAASCNYEQQHSEHVTDLAIQIYEQLVEQLDTGGATWTKPIGRELLLAAAVLHDIGYYINYSRHHKHSYHLIIHSELPGFTHRELDIIANVARYHRRAEPKSKHPAYAKLSDDDRELVKRLSAILRVADGLDRAHSQFVRAVTLEIRDSTAWFLVDAEANPVVDIWGAARKSQLFQKTFGLDSRFEWSGNGESEPAATEATLSGGEHRISTR